MCITTTALALSAAPAIAGVCPEAFMSSLNRVMLAQASDTCEGTITTVAADWSTFSVRQSDDEIVKITINKDTVYTLDGKVVERNLALSAGRHAKITHEDKVASRVDVMLEK